MKPSVWNQGHIRTLVILGLVLATAVAAFMVFGRNKPSDPNLVESSPVSVASTPTVVKDKQASVPPQAMPPEPKPLTPAAVQQILRQRTAELDVQLLEDPRIDSWAAPLETSINTIIRTSGFADEKQYGISQHSVECRSHACRINLTFPKDDLADEATMLIRREIANTFKQALTVRLVQPDGSYEYRIYAITPGNDALLRKSNPQARPGSMGDSPRAR